MDFSYIQAAVLGLVQGLTEFIPISSSGHLVIVRDLLHIPDQGSLFDAILHIATLLAILIYFRSDWLLLIQSWSKNKNKSKGSAQYKKLSILILLATIPGLIVGYSLHGWVEHSLRSTTIVAILMIVLGILFIVGEKLLYPKSELHQLNWGKALSIGSAQALALLPGFSRSGATILVAMYTGIKRELAAKFSFLLAAPIIAAAGTYSLFAAISEGLTYDWVFAVIAFVFSFISGFLAIKFLLNFLKKYSLNIFAYYLIIVGAALLVFKLI